MTPAPPQTSGGGVSPEDNATGQGAEGGEALVKDSSASVFPRKAEDPHQRARVKHVVMGRELLGHGTVSPHVSPVGAVAGRGSPLHRPQESRCSRDWQGELYRYEGGPPPPRQTGLPRGCPAGCPQPRGGSKGACTALPLGGAVSQGLASLSLSFLIC